MKKKYILLLIMILLLNSGCAKKRELVCKKVSTDFDNTTESNYIVKFKNNKVSKIIIQEIVTVTDEYASFIDPYVQSAQAAVKEYKSYDGFTAKSSKATNTVTLTVEATPSKMTEEDKNKYNVSLSYDEYKKELESESYKYTCK